MAETTIFAKDLVKQFKTDKGFVNAVNHLTLEVGRGETYGLIGPDGAGKTTTTRVILGILTRTAGESSVMGFDSMRDMYQIRERVGYIAQQFSLPSKLTVMENMRFFADTQSVSPELQKKRIPELLEFAGLKDYTDRLAGNLSGGMKKKLALACSLIHEPQVLLLDEPTLGVDPVSRREFWSILGNLRAEKGLTIFVCTPYMDEAERCTQVGLIYSGRLIASGSPASIKAMLPGDLLELAPSDLAGAQRLLQDMPGILETQTYGDKLHLFVDQAAQRQPMIESTLAAAGITFSGMRPLEVRMEEAFISLIRHEQAASPQIPGAPQPGERAV